MILYYSYLSYFCPFTYIILHSCTYNIPKTVVFYFFSFIIIAWFPSLKLFVNMFFLFFSPTPYSVVIVVYWLVLSQAQRIELIIFLSPWALKRPPPLHPNPNPIPSPFRQPFQLFDMSLKQV